MRSTSPPCSSSSFSFSLSFCPVPPSPFLTASVKKSCSTSRRQVSRNIYYSPPLLLRTPFDSKTATAHSGATKVYKQHKFDPMLIACERHRGVICYIKGITVDFLPKTDTSQLGDPRSLHSTNSCFSSSNTSARAGILWAGWIGKTEISLPLSNPLGSLQKVRFEAHFRSVSAPRGGGPPPPLSRAPTYQRPFCAFHIGQVRRPGGGVRGAKPRH